MYSRLRTSILKHLFFKVLNSKLTIISLTLRNDLNGNWKTDRNSTTVREYQCQNNQTFVGSFQVVNKTFPVDAHKTTDFQHDKMAVLQI